MKILGITTQNHDASLALVSGNRILWAGHSERYSRKKNDNVLNQDMIDEMLTYGKPEKIIFFEDVVEKSSEAREDAFESPRRHPAITFRVLRAFPAFQAAHLASRPDLLLDDVHDEIR